MVFGKQQVRPESVEVQQILFYFRLQLVEQFHFLTGNDTFRLPQLWHLLLPDFEEAAK